jgi:hypothetical protein
MLFPWYATMSRALESNFEIGLSWAELALGGPPATSIRASLRTSAPS